MLDPQMHPLLASMLVLHTYNLKQSQTYEAALAPDKTHPRQPGTKLYQRFVRKFGILLMKIGGKLIHRGTEPFQEDPQVMKRRMSGLYLIGLDD